MISKSLRQQAFAILLLTWIVYETSAVPCILREYKTGLVCVCNATYCDTLELEAPSAEGEVVLISTSKNGLRFKDAGARFNDERTILTDLQFTKREFTRGERQNFWLFNVFNKPVDVVVNRDKKFQTIVGFGNAFTGTVSHLLKHAPDLNENIFRSYFSKDVGNGFNMIRMPIGGSDFDLEPWAYNELPVNDVALSNFTKFDKRDVERNAQIKNLRTVSGNWDIKFVGAAWSSPKWMKTNGEWTGFSALKDEYFQTWADYHVKFLEMMKNDGIDFWAISTGNEPLNGVSAYLFIKFMSLGWLPNTQGKWVAENLGPSLNKSQSVSHVKILAGDDQRYTVPYWFDQMYATYPKSEKFVSGHAVHWYWDKYVSADRLDLSHQKYPEKLIIATEACSGDKPWEEHRPLLGDWSRCEDYIVDIIQDLNHYANAWIDWNMILDPNGGPNYVSNFVDSPMVINTTSNDEFYKQPTFYALGHFSRFILPDSVRVDSTSSSTNIHVTSFERPDGLISLVIYNAGSYATDVDVKDSKRGVVKLNIPAKSIHSMLYM